MNLLRMFLFSIIPMLSLASYAAPPSQSGPNVFRGEVPLWYFYVDNGMTAIHGLDIADACFNGVTFELWSGKQIQNPADENLTMGFINDKDMPTFVWADDFLEFLPNGSLDGPAICTKVVQGAIPIAQGMVKVTAMDSNSSGLPIDNNRAHRGHLRAHGKLLSTDLEKMNFSGGFGCVVDGPAQSCSIRIKLR